MEVLNTVLPIIIDVLLIVLLASGIILIIKCIYIIDKAKSLVMNVQEKVNSLNSLFSVVSLVNDKITGVAENLIAWIESLFSKIFKKDNDEVVEVEVIKKKSKKGKERK